MIVLLNMLLNKSIEKMAHNVPAVYEVGGGTKGLCEAKTRAGKLWV